jgi:hypothetical protein
LTGLFLFRLELTEGAGWAGGLGFAPGSLVSAEGRLFQSLHFFQSQAPMCSPGEFAQLQRSNGDSFESGYLVANRGQDAANFPIASFGQDHFQNGTRSLFLFQGDSLHLGFTFSQVDTSFELLQLIQRGTADTLDKVSLFDSELGVSQAKGEVAVIGNDDQPFAALVQAADVIDPQVSSNQVDHAGSAIGVFVRRKHSRWFVQHEVLQLLAADLFAINADFLSFRIDLGAEFSARFAIDLNPAVGD